MRHPRGNSVFAAGVPPPAPKPKTPAVALVNPNLEPALTEPERTPDYTRLTPTDVALILRLSNEGRQQIEIAQVIGCHHSTVSRCLAEFSCTRVMAQARLANAADRFATRVIEYASVDQSLEMLDRLDVANRKRDETRGDTKVQILVGMPGSPLSLPQVVTVSDSAPKG